MPHGRYVLEIHAPHDEQNALATFESDTPFMSVHAGDLIARRSLPEGTREDDAPLIVTHVEHNFSNGSSGPLHTLSVYTKREQPRVGFRI